MDDRASPSVVLLDAGSNRFSVLNRHTLEAHLREAKRHVSLGEGGIARQQAVIDELERDGHDSELARQLLDTFEKLQAMHIADVKRLEAELAAAREQPKKPM